MEGTLGVRLRILGYIFFAYYIAEGDEIYVNMHVYTCLLQYNFTPTATTTCIQSVYLHTNVV